MDNLHCQRCGEEYSKTYRRCPFCQELAAERRGRPMYRHGKRLSRRERSAGAGSVLKLVILSIALIAVISVFFGDDIARLMGIRTDTTVTDRNEVGEAPSTPDVGSEDPPSQPDDTDTPEPPVVPDEPDTGGEGGEDIPPETVTVPLTLSHSAITIPAGETARITADGGSGDIAWSSSNTEIATVEGGAVTGVAGGTVTVTATTGSETVTCTVTVTGDPWISPAELSLNRTDFTLAAGDPPFQLKVKGTDSPVTWSSSNVNVATVDSSGIVRRVGKGNATITAEVDGQTLTCIVRVP